MSHEGKAWRVVFEGKKQVSESARFIFWFDSPDQS